MRIRGLLSSSFAVGVGFVITSDLSAQPVINEIHYDPPDPIRPAEFIELHNPGIAPVSLAGWRLSGGIAFTFPTQTVLPAGGFLVVAQDPSTIQSQFGTSALGPWTGRLRNEDERVELRDSSGTLVDRVGFQLGFPWPTVGTPPGYSIELIHPYLDNDLGGNWRASVLGNAGSPARTTLVRARSEWRYFRGLNAPSEPATAWRDPDFIPETWESGPLPIGYDPALSLGTRLDDMRNGYTSVFLLKTFTLDQPTTITSLELHALYDDGFKVWINGRPVLESNVASGDLPFNATAGTARESDAYETFALSPPPGTFVAGRNVIAVQAFNSSLSASSDFYFDAQLDALSGPTGRGPSPGRINWVYATNAPPAIRQVEHTPVQPKTGQPVRISARITDPDGIGPVSLRYQIVEPGQYIEATDAAYENVWAELPMRDDGLNGDAAAGDSTFTVTLPGSIQVHRRLIRYRLETSDRQNASIRVPYSDDPQPNFAYFVYDGAPAWTGAIKPGDAGDLGRRFMVDATEMNRLPILHLIAKKTAVEESTWFSRYGGDAYPWTGTLVFQGKVYDHIHYRARGGVWRYAMAKNMWKFDFQRGHDFQAVDDWGRPFEVPWSKLNLGASIQQGDFNHRGEQGMFESVGFRVFRLAGVPAMHSAYAQFRVIDEPSEAPAEDPYGGDFWGVYLMIEQPDGRFLKQHGLPEGNLYKMEGGGGEANHVGPAGPADGSDLTHFLQEYSSTSEAWWRSQVDIANYLSYQTVVQAIHHYDICYDKNFFYYRNPSNQLWQVIPWDLDLTWADNMFDAGCGGVDRIKQRLLPSATRFPKIWRGWQNRIREFRDLFWNADEAARLIDEQAGRLRGPNKGPTVLDADRAQWDYNPRMSDSTYTSAGTSKAGQGRYYRWPAYPASTVSRDFQGCVQLMKRYVDFRASDSSARARALDLLAADNSIPARPALSSVGPAEFPVNGLRFRTSAYSGAGAFGKMRWRLGEISRPTSPDASATSVEPWKYEITPVWESGDLSAYEPEIAVPPGVLRVGSIYRARVQWEDSEGRTSSWSEPVEFVAGPALASADAASSLRLTELMYNAPEGSTNDFLELHNAGTSTLNLAGFTFTQGIDYILPAGTTLAPGGYLIVTKAPATANFAAFRAYYGLSTSVPIVGPYSGNLSDAGEELSLGTAVGGTTVIHFTYSDSRGWPEAADGVGHSLVPKQDFGSQANHALEYGGNWRASAFLRGSPGRADPQPDTSVVLNEIVAHTDFLGEFDSNDWIEVFNRSSTNIALGDNWYLSDSASNLKQWRIPVGTTLPPRSFLTFDEVTGFNQPRGTGFGINKAGETIFLSHFPAGTPGRVVDAVSFKAQENEWALARIPDGGETWDAVSPRTRQAPNPPLAPRVALSEVLFHEDDATTVELPSEAREFVELHNSTRGPVDLFNPYGTWRLAGGIDYAFTQLIALGAGECLLIVSWDPSANPGQLAAFRRAFSIPNSVRIFGPYTGRLHNDTDRIALERPQAPDIVGDPITWVIVDEITYHDSNPWPTGADGTGKSLQRTSSMAPGNSPSSWITATPTAGFPTPTGSQDTDGDSMPDAWEVQYGLNPSNPADAALDFDVDGASNANEYAAGTDPTLATSTFRITSVRRSTPGGVEIRFPAVAGKAYVLEASSTPDSHDWSAVQSIPPPSQSGEVSVSVNLGPTEVPRFFRVRLE